MQAAAFLSAERAIDHQRGDGHKVAKLQEVGRDLEIPVKLLHLGVEVSQSGRGALEALVGADDSHIVPHESADFFPVVRDHHQLVHILHLAGTPLG